ncbi:MAG TPA: hypothetical protein VHE37_16490 [Nevskiaceae bacterium]|nr:hypothetical protein [Nevskiaceae bacterium]
MGSLAALSEWIEQHEALLASHLLINPADASGHRGLCAAFLSRATDGAFHLRLCEGANDEFLTWRHQRKVQPMFGRSYAEATLGTWLSEREREGYRATWSATLHDTPASMGMAVPA